MLMIGKKSELKGRVSMVEVLDMLDERKKYGELTYEQQKSYEHAEKIVDKVRFKKAKEKLEELGILNDASVIKLAELLPKGQMLVKQIIASEGKTFDDAQVTKILAITSGK
jgi:DNA-directed RNA polymerase subunit F